MGDEGCAAGGSVPVGGPAFSPAGLLNESGRAQGTGSRGKSPGRRALPWLPSRTTAVVERWPGYPERATLAALAMPAQDRLTVPSAAGGFRQDGPACGMVPPAPRGRGRNRRNFVDEQDEPDVLRSCIALAVCAAEGGPDMRLATMLPASTAPGTSRSLASRQSGICSEIPGQQAHLPCAPHRLRSLPHAQLGEQLADVIAYAKSAEAELGGDLLVPMFSEPLQHFHLARGQRRLQRSLGPLHRRQERSRRFRVADIPVRFQKGGQGLCAVLAFPHQRHGVSAYRFR